jgi:DNA-directed RNA polymerase specialized sigma24 family protein
MESADAAILRRALAGSNPDLISLVRVLTPAVQASVARVFLQGARASHLWNVREEIREQTQEVMLLLFEDDAAILRAWREDAGLSLASFAGLVARRRTISRLRSKRRNPWTDSPIEQEDLEAVRATGDGPEQLLANVELLDVARSDVASTLNERGRQLLQWIVIEDRDNDELAAVTQMSLASIYQWRSRLTRALRDRIHELLGEVAR